MKLIIVAVRDSKSEAFGMPQCVQSMGIASRSFADEINRPAEQNIMYHHPDDFGLYALGKYDDETGVLEQDGPPKLLIMGGDVAVREGKKVKVVVGKKG